LATALGTLPSRLVAIVDELESKGLLERRPHESDRRSYALHLTEKGKANLQAIGNGSPGCYVQQPPGRGAGQEAEGFGDCRQQDF
jgi:DNA-binding MarR family transcriptional regulator